MFGINASFKATSLFKHHAQTPDFLFRIAGWQELPKFCLIVLGAMEAKILGLLDAGELYDAFTTNCQVPWEVFLSRPRA